MAKLLIISFNTLYGRIISKEIRIMSAVEDMPIAFPIPAGAVTVSVEITSDEPENSETEHSPILGTSHPGLFDEGVMPT